MLEKLFKEEMVNERVFLAIAVLVLGFVFLTNIYIMQVNEDTRFFIGIDGLNHVSSVITQQQDYSPVSISFMSFLIDPNRPVFFYFIHALLLFVVIPLMLFKASSHWLAPLFYYSSYFVWLSDNNGTLPQTLIVFLLLAMFLVKNNYVRVGIVVLSFGVHSFGWVLLVVWLFCLNFKGVE